MVHEIALADYTASCDGAGNVSLGTVDSYGQEWLHITADENWDGMSIVVTFFNKAGTDVLMDANGMVKVPPEATLYATNANNKGKMIFTGTAPDMRRITRNMSFTVADHV